MQTYYWNGHATTGLKLVQDEQYGWTLYLGEGGPGNRSTARVSVDKHDPAPVTERGLMLDAQAKVVVLHKGQPNEFRFVTFAKSKEENSKSALVLIDSNGGYRKNTFGGSRTVQGDPIYFASGRGGTGIKARAGGWTQSLVEMSPGDAIEINMSGGAGTYVLELTDQGFKQYTANEWRDLRQTDRVIAAVAGGTLETVFESIRIATWDNDSLTSGVNLLLSQVRLSKAGKLLVVSATESEPKTDQMLVWVKSGETQYLYGNPDRLDESFFTSDSHGVEKLHGQFMLVSQGDAMRLYGRNHALSYSQDGLVLQTYDDWKLEDAKRNPQPWIEKNWCPVELVPQTWVGEVVGFYSHAHKELENYHHYLAVITSVNPLKLKYEWAKPTNEQFLQNITTPPSDTVWLKLEPKHKPNVPAEKIGTEEIGPERIEIPDKFFPESGKLEAIVQPSASGYAATAKVIANVKAEVTSFRLGQVVPIIETRTLRQVEVEHTFEVQLAAGVHKQGHSLFGKFTIEARYGGDTRYIVILPEDLPDTAWVSNDVQVERVRLANELYKEYRAIRSIHSDEVPNRCYDRVRNLQIHMVWATGDMHRVVGKHSDIDLSKFDDPAAEFLSQDFTISASRIPAQELKIEDYYALVWENKNRRESYVFGITPSGERIFPSRMMSNVFAGQGREDSVFEAAAPNCLILSRTVNPGAYGRVYSVEFTVHNKPEKISQEQLTTVKTVLEEGRTTWTIFVGPKCCWDLSRQGSVIFTTENWFNKPEAVDFGDELDKGPVDPFEFRTTQSQEQGREGKVVKYTVYPQCLKPALPIATVPAPSAEPVSFQVTETKGAWYKCTCGRTDNLKGKQREAFKQGEVVTVTCGDTRCKQVGTVQKPS